MSNTQLGLDWRWIETVGELEIALPDSPERLELGEGASACRLLLSDEFGDAFGVLLDGSEAHLAVALAHAFDQLYGVEWGTAGTPTIDVTSTRAELEIFGERHVALWRRRTATMLLFAVVRPERTARAQAFVSSV